MQGGDGFVALQDPSDFRIAYSESQDGNMVRIDRVTNETTSIRPLPPAGEPPYRWNWDTPMIQCPHDAKVLYVAANKVFRSADRGLNWTVGQPRPHEQRQPRRHRHDGREGERHPHLEGRRHRGVADDRLARGVAEARGPALRRHRRRERAGDARRGEDVDQHHGEDPGPAEGRLGVRARAVAIRRGDRLRDVRRPSPERLRHLRLREPRTTGRRGSRRCRAT